MSNPECMLTSFMTYLSLDQGVPPEVRMLGSIDLKGLLSIDLLNAESKAQSILRTEGSSKLQESWKLH